MPFRLSCCIVLLSLRASMAPVITHYKFRSSNNTFKVDIALKEKGLSSEDVYIDLFKGEQHSAAFHAINNRDMIPALTYGDAKVSESMAILQFIDMAFPNEVIAVLDMAKDTPGSVQVSLTPKDPVNLGLCLKYIHELGSCFDPKNICYQAIFLKQGKEELAEKIDALHKEIAVWDGYLENKEFLAGDSISLADIGFFPMMAQMKWWLGLDLASYPNIDKWYKVMEQRPSIKGHPFFELAAKLDETMGLDPIKRRVLA